MDCPHCGCEAVRHDDTDGHASPKIGDASLCGGCYCVSVFETGPFGLYRRKPTNEENDMIMADLRVHEALAALAAHSDSYAAIAALRRAAGASPCSSYGGHPELRDVELDSGLQ